MTGYYISFASHSFVKISRPSLRFIKAFGGMDRIIRYSQNDISERFMRENSNIFNGHHRGFGNWLWKPYLVRETLKKMNSGDFLVYGDSSVFIFRNIHQSFEEMLSEQDIVGFQLPFLERSYTSPELRKNKEFSSELLWDSNQINATFFAIKKTVDSVKFVDRWLDLCKKEEFLCAPSLKDVFEHRHDQSIFSLLYKERKYRPMPDLSIHGAYPEIYYSFFSKEYLTSIGWVNCQKRKASSVRAVYLKRRPIFLGIVRICIKMLKSLILRRMFR